MKVFLLGLDGMTSRVIMPYVEKNFLPNFKKVMDNGVSGILRSTIPPVTAPAWASLVTGKTPMKHGVFEFRQLTGYETTFITKNSSSTAEPIWDILSRNGKTVNILNVPLTYPPDKVNGVMVSGMMTPNIRTDFTFPKEIKQDIFKLIPDYRIDIETREFLSSCNKDALLKQVFKITHDRRKLMHYFLDKQSWDLFFITLVGPDRIQHFMWEDVMAMHPECVRYYSLLDDVLGDILQRMDSDSLLFIVSDHGFDATKKAFAINKFLEETSLLHLRKNKKAKHKSKKTKTGRTVLFLIGLLAKMKLLRLKKYLPPTLLNSLKNRFWSIVSGKNEVDWQKTKVFSFLLHDIRVNLKGREPLGSVEPQDYDKLCDKVRDALLKVRDPETGENIVQNVFKGSELYPTDQTVDNKPDLIFVLNNGYNAYYDLVADGILTDTKSTGPIYSAYHDMDGLLLAYGHNVENIKTNADIYDIVPTILYCLGLPIPKDIDGRVLTEVMNPEFVVKNKIRFETSTEYNPSQKNKLTKEEEEELERQLKNLGYLS